MNVFSQPTSSDRLVIYLNDHRALLAAELAIANRCRSSNEGSELAHDLTVHIGEVTTDQVLLDECITSLNGTVDRLKTGAALLAERLGRLKTNGQLIGYSPLSRLIELEALIAATRGRLSVWNTLDHCSTSALLPAEPGNRGHIAHEQITILERHHRAATDAAFKPAGTP